VQFSLNSFSNLLDNLNWLRAVAAS
jgi:hypothetical protein